MPRPPHSSARRPKALKRVQVKVPVKSLKCGHGAMDDNLYKALNADATPESATSSRRSRRRRARRRTRSRFTPIGTLTVAGKENKVTMDVVATRLADGTVKAKGIVPIKMTDYGIKPPTAIFGRLKTGDEVKVNFELIVGGKAIATALRLGQPYRLAATSTPHRGIPDSVDRDSPSVFPPLPTELGPTRPRLHQAGGVVQLRAHCRPHEW